MGRMISAIVIMASFSLGAAFPVAENGKAKCVIVHPDRIEAWNRGRYPNLMVLELKKYLEKMTGAVFEIYPESKAPKDTPAIFAGDRHLETGKTGVENQIGRQPRDPCRRFRHRFHVCAVCFP